MKAKRNLFYKIVGVSLVIVALIFAIGQRDIYREIENSISLYNQVYKQVFTNYVEPIKPEKYTEESINLMLEQLDPYTELLNLEQRESIDMMTEGEYGGVGMRISKYNDTITVISPIDGSPAFRAGIRPGDQILMIDTLNIVGMSLGEAARKIRGKVGTKVKLIIRRPGVFEKMEYELTREKIQIHDISYAGYVDEGIFYLRLSDFSRGASREIKETLTKEAGIDNLKALILDLRGNPGGLLDEAIKVAELFTDPGDTLLFTRGRVPTANRYFISRRKPIVGNSVKMAVLIDRGSASASEIIAGIVQDLDRGVVIGSRSFGKGLVQTVFKLDDKHTLKITTAKYFTPSGRLIQKSDFIRNPEVIVSDIEEDSVFYSKNGRRLKSHGGIYPDIVIEGERLAPIVQALWRDNFFYSFAINYMSKHEDIPEPIVVDDKMLKEFKEYVKEKGFDFQFDVERTLRKVEEKLKSDERFNGVVDFSKIYEKYRDMKEEEWNKNVEQIKLGIKAELGMLKGGLAGRIKATLSDDKVVAKAIEILKDEISYANILGYRNE